MNNNVTKKRDKCQAWITFVMQTDYSLKCNLKAICLFPSKSKLLPISFGIPLNCTAFHLYRRNRLPLQPFFHAEALHL